MRKHVQKTFKLNPRIRANLSYHGGRRGHFFVNRAYTCTVLGAHNTYARHTSAPRGLGHRVTSHPRRTFPNQNVCYADFFGAELSISPIGRLNRRHIVPLQPAGLLYYVVLSPRLRQKRAAGTMRIWEGKENAKVGRRGDWSMCTVQYDSQNNF
jgi:hypothetical protein